MCLWDSDLEQAQVHSKWAPTPSFHRLRVAATSEGKGDPLGGLRSLPNQYQLAFGKGRVEWRDKNHQQRHNCLLWLRKQFYLQQYQKEQNTQEKNEPRRRKTCILKTITCCWKKLTKISGKALWFLRLNIAKVHSIGSMQSLSNPGDICCRNRNSILKFMQTLKRSQIAPQILEKKKNKVGGLTILDFKIYYKGTKSKQDGTGIDRHVNQ